MAKNNNKSLLKNPYFRISSILIGIIFLLGIGILSFKFIHEKMFSENPRFRLRNVIVRSSGYWNNRSEDIMRILDLKKGITNLFNLNISELRKTLENKRGEGIASAEISKELPDTLKVEIIERIPQAVLYNKKSGMLTDKEGVVMDSRYFKDMTASLPIITGFKISENNKAKSNYFGQTISVIRPALVFISIINEDYSDMEIKVINLYSPNKLLVFMKISAHQVIKITLPFQYSTDPPTTNAEIAESSKLIKYKLNELRELLKYLKWKNNPFTEINMIYKDQAVVK